MYVNYGNFGYFGKGVISPAPGPAPEEAEVATAEVSAARAPSHSYESRNLTAREVAPSSKLPASVAVRSRPGDSEVRSRLDELRAEIAARRESRRAKVRAVQERQAKQAAYGRGASSRGARTESEIAIGVSTGYYGYDHRFGATEDDPTTQVEKAADDVKKATELVKQLTKDVKRGSSPRSELEKALANLTYKVKRAQSLAEKTGLQGYGEEPQSKWPLVTTLTVLGITAYLFLPR